MNKFQIEQVGEGAPYSGVAVAEQKPEIYRSSGPALGTILQRSESHQNPDYNPAPVPVIQDMGRPALKKSKGSKISAVVSAEWRT
jgi:hypothetical protein